jgi:hypothetical protein
MIKQIGSIAIFVDVQLNKHTGREYIDNASIQFWDLTHNLIRNTGLTSVVNTESDLWEHVESTVQSMIDEGHGIDEPEVSVYRSHKTSTQVDFFETIGRHL